MEKAFFWSGRGRTGMIRAAASMENGVAATVDRREATGARWDVIVIGAGPAGAAAAVHLANGGRRVLLVDRGGMPRAKVCGCCLSGVAVDELAAIGLAPGLLGGLPRTRVRLVVATREAVLPLAGWTLSREALDEAIVRRAVTAGAAWMPWTPVSSIEETETGVTVVAKAAGADRLRLSAVHAVVATGLGAGPRIRPDGAAWPRIRPRAASRIGVGATLPGEASIVDAGELVMHVAPEGYCGLVRLEDGRVDVAAAVDPAALAAAASAEAAVARVCRGRLGPVDGFQAGHRFTGTPRLTHFSPPVVGRWRRIHRIGDAAAYVEPFTGEGIGWALVGGRSIAEAMLSSPPIDAAGTATAIAATHERAIARRLVGPRKRCLKVSAAVRHRSVVSAAVSIARLVPAAAAWAVPLLVGGVGDGDADSGSVRP